MKWTMALPEFDEDQRQPVGGKAIALARMARSGFEVPRTICISREAKRGYVTAAGSLFNRVGRV